MFSSQQKSIILGHWNIFDNFRIVCVFYGCFWNFLDKKKGFNFLLIFDFLNFSWFCMDVFRIFRFFQIFGIFLTIFDNFSDFFGLFWIFVTFFGILGFFGIFFGFLIFFGCFKIFYGLFGFFWKLMRLQLKDIKDTINCLKLAKTAY